jgi:hypothetical protein
MCLSKCLYLIPINFSCNLSSDSCAMAEAVSHWPVTADAQSQLQANPQGIQAGQSGTWIDFSPSPSVFPCQDHSTIAPYLFTYPYMLLIPGGPMGEG